MQKILFIHCRRGLFQLTICNSCKHTWQCDNCTANLVTYKRYGEVLDLLCHQCQSSYKYPSKCPECGDEQIVSNFGGIDDLQETLEKEYQLSVVRLDKGLADKNPARMGIQEQEDQTNTQKQAYLTTRIYDPSLDYSIFDRIIFIQADNLLAAPDYLVQEEITKSLSELFIALMQSGNKTQIIFDTKDPTNPYFKSLIALDEHNPQKIDLTTWYKNFLHKESINRKIFNFPPFTNLLLLTSQEKTFEKAKSKLVTVKAYLDTIKKDFEDVSYGSPYPAKFLKRKGMFSYHLLIRFPRNYKQFFSFKTEIQKLASTHNLQVRLNPRHLF